ncbi:OST-HTH/LOTUS domain-containing protein [Chromobacterium vaccinii]|uniref:OST-HTH/LOTUS domain-containing protein n=1 Tax=Chromobacterium vaccinii TaxID=1108595 RepID=UPI00326074B9
MSFNASVYRILIASPGDVADERAVIPEIVNEWNAVSAYSTKIILMPIKWEVNTTPLLGGRPQQVINDQIVKDADLLVGVFWTRIGTKTGMAESGTAEEIQQFVDSGKPVMLYFSQSPIDPEKIDIEQFGALKKFKEKMRTKGLTETYSGLVDFRHKFTRQLAINLNNLIDFLAEQLKSKGKEPSKKVTEQQKSAVIELTKPTQSETEAYLLKSFEATVRPDGWADIAAFATHLLTYTPIKYRDYGHNKLKPFLQSTGLFEFKSISKTQTDITLVEKSHKNA